MGSELCPLELYRRCGPMILCRSNEPAAAAVGTHLKPVLIDTTTPTEQFRRRRRVGGMESDAQAATAAGARYLDAAAWRSGVG